VTSGDWRRLGTNARQLALSENWDVQGKRFTTLFQSNIITGDELILQPGEGLALYQETNAGDNLMQYRLFVSWKEVAANTPHLTLSGFRLFANSNSLDVGSALAALNTAASLNAAGDAFRLRTLIHVATSSLAQGRQNFTLQFAGKEQEF
jgi:hypothetical protein